MFGLLIVDKPPGITSHGVIARIRRAAGIRGVGHTGTLDPFATGVLVVCLGSATRLVRYLESDRKGYRARVRTGTSTTTYDLEGDVVAHSSALVSPADIERALAPFRGKILQVPPMFSAKSVGGVRLHELARRGIEIPRDPVPVEIERLELVGVRDDGFDLDIACSKGTYVRALAHDLGLALGTYAHLVALDRTRCGAFTKADATPLGDLEDSGAVSPRLRSPLDGMSGMARRELDADDAVRFRQGKAIRVTPGLDAVPPGSAVAATLLATGELLGVGRATSDGTLAPETVFPAVSSAAGGAAIGSIEGP